MSAATPKNRQSSRSHRPRASAVFAAAFIAGAAAAVGVNRVLDVHIAQSRPKVESEPIFVALRGLPQGSPVTVWDVALRDWPKAMLPATAMRPQDSFEGTVLKHPLREGQPLLSVQLVKVAGDDAGRLAADAAPIAAPKAAIPAASPPAGEGPQPDLWAPAEQPTAAQPPVEQAAPAVATASEPVTTDAVPTTTEATAAEPVVPAVTVASAPISADVEPAAPVQPAPSQASRYLVVPERIALQADRSFVPPGAGVRAIQPPAIEETVQPVVQKPVEIQQTQIRPGRTASSKRQPQRAAANPGQKTPAKGPDQSSFGSMFPNLSAGVNAVGEQLEIIKRERSQQDAAAAKSGEAQRQRSQQQQQSREPAPRSALLPFFRGQ